jgi:hypothetical protein
MKKLLALATLGLVSCTPAHAFDPVCAQIGEYAGTFLEYRYDGVPITSPAMQGLMNDSPITKMMVEDVYAQPWVEGYRSRVRQRVAFEMKHEALCLEERSK